MCCIVRLTNSSALCGKDVTESMSESKDYSIDELLTMLEDMQSQNEAQRTQLENYKKLLSKAKAELLAERAAQERAQAKLIDTMRTQEQTLTELNASNNSLRLENEKLLKLSESERQLSNENARLRTEVKTLKKSLEDQVAAATEVKRLTQASAAEYRQAAKAFDKLPSAADIDTLSKAVRRSTNVIRQGYIYTYIHWGIALLFAALVALAGGFIYWTREDVADTKSAVTRGLYDKDGWGVLNGTQSDDAHQRYLQQKQ